MSFNEVYNKSKFGYFHVSPRRFSVHRDSEDNIVLYFDCPQFGTKPFALGWAEDHLFKVADITQPPYFSGVSSVSMFHESNLANPITDAKPFDAAKFDFYADILKDTMWLRIRTESNETYYTIFQPLWSLFGFPAKLRNLVKRNPKETRPDQDELRYASACGYATDYIEIGEYLKQKYTDNPNVFIQSPDVLYRMDPKAHIWRGLRLVFGEGGSCNGWITNIPAAIRYCEFFEVYEEQSKNKPEEQKEIAEILEDPFTAVHKSLWGCELNSQEAEAMDEFKHRNGIENLQ